VGTVVLLSMVATATLARASGLEPGPVLVVVALTPYVALLALVTVLVALASRQVVLVLLAAVLAVVQVAWQVPLFTAAPPQGGTTALVVATVNLRFGEGDPTDVVALVRDHHVDLLALEELTPQARTSLRSAGLDALLPYSAAQPGDSFTGVGVWSRSPVRQSREVPGFASALVVASVATRVGDVTVVATHPVAPEPLDHQHWAREMAALGGLLAPRRGPVVVAGDLNSTRDQAPLRRILDLGYADAADQAGAGFVMTYPVGGVTPPVVAIDHVLVRDLGLVATRFDTVSVAGSDHRGVVVVYA
jgi:endonuclease/exonuclease/phosphatase (EEP) superfamily protein YafD